LIIGVSVVGGVAVLGAAIFLYMKFGGKRFTGYEDDDSEYRKGQGSNGRAVIGDDSVEKDVSIGTP